MFQENSIETCILSRVKQITSPGWTNETSARIWCTGKTQRDRVERKVGGGIGMRNTCKSDRVTGRKVRGLQTEEIGCKCQTFLSLLSGRRKQTSDIFSFSVQIQK